MSFCPMYFKIKQNINNKSIVSVNTSTWWMLLWDYTCSHLLKIALIDNFTKSFISLFNSEMYSPNINLGLPRWHHHSIPQSTPVASLDNIHYQPPPQGKGVKVLHHGGQIITAVDSVHTRLRLPPRVSTLRFGFRKNFLSDVMIAERGWWGSAD